MTGAMIVRWRHPAAVVGGFVLLFVWLFAQPLTTGRLLAESDLFDQYLPLFRSPALVWSSFEFGGVPAFADPENSAFYPIRWLFAHVVHSWNGFMVAAFILAGCFTYAYLYSQTRSRGASAFGAVGFALSESMIERLPHANILHAVVWMPLLLLALDGVLVGRRRMLWVALAGFAGANCILAGHPQLALYLAYLSAGYALTGLLAQRATLGQWTSVAAAAVLALLLSAVSVVPLVELSDHTVRQTFAFSEFVDYSNTPRQMLSALFPAVTHSGLEAPTYVGLVTLPLAIVGAMQRPTNWRVTFWVVVAIAGVLLGVGGATPLAKAAYGLPLYDRFRIVSRHLIFAAFAIDVLAAYGLAAIGRGAVSRRAFATASLVFAVVVVGAALLLAQDPSGVRFDRINEAFPLPWLVDGVWVQLAVAAVSLAVVVAAWRYSRVEIAAYACVLILIGDLLHASAYQWTPRGLSVVTVEPSAAAPGVHARKLAAELAPSRQRFVAAPDSLRDEVVPGLFARPWAIPSAGGYTSLLLRDVSVMALISANGHVEPAALSARDLGLDLLAVKYLVARGVPVAAAIDRTRWRDTETFSISRSRERGVGAGGVGENSYTVFENLHALPRAWLASEVRPTTDGVMSDVIRTARFRDGTAFDPGATALVFEGDVPSARYPPGGSATVTSIGDGRIAVDVSAPGGGFLVLSEAFYPGWRARIGDQPAEPVHRTDIALQGISVPAGRHRVTFEFASRSRLAGAALSGVGLVGIGALVFMGMRQR